jgi:hypothetical protein
MQPDLLDLKQRDTLRQVRLKLLLHDPRVKVLLHEDVH